jgi:hypothetical protein
MPAIISLMKPLPFSAHSALLIVFALHLLTVGCTQVQVAPDVRGEYRLGELQVFAEGDFATVYEATKLGLAEQKLFITQDHRLVVEAELKARDASDTMVIVKIKELSPNRTSVKIRYGLRGDLASAQRVYDSIQRRL